MDGTQSPPVMSKGIPRWLEGDLSLSKGGMASQMATCAGTGGASYSARRNCLAYAQASRRY